jgi:hypothetical protein
MPNYRLILYRDNRLDRWKPIEATDWYDAVQQAYSEHSDDLVELWCDSKKIAIFRPAKGHRA